MPFTLSTVLVETYKFLWRERSDLWSYALLPVVIVAGVKTATLWLLGDWETFFAPPPPPQEVSPGNMSPMPGIDIGVAGVINLIVGFVTYVMFAVAWHRRYLVGNEGQTIGAALRWGPRHWRFSARFVALIGIVVIIGWGISFPIALLAGSGGSMTPASFVLMFFVVFIVLGLAYGRLLLVLPAAAKDETLGFRTSFGKTDGKSWLMFGIGILPPFPVLAVMMLVVAPVATTLANAIGPSVSLMLVILLVQQVFSFAAIAAGVTALSIAHRHLASS